MEIPHDNSMVYTESDRERDLLVKIKDWFLYEEQEIDGYEPETEEIELKSGVK